MRNLLVTLVTPACLLVAGLVQFYDLQSAEAGGADTANASSESVRHYVDLDSDWQFRRGDFASAMLPGFNDSSWRTVDVPHDWSSEGPFGSEYASATGYAPGGIGWYRKHFRLDAAYKDKQVTVEFDGIYANSQVWINGHFVGGRPNGYSSFECVLTPQLTFGEQDNVLTVRVDHSRFSDSRWYTGSGIYRHARLRITDPFSIAHWGVFVTTPVVSEKSVTVRIETTLQNATNAARALSLQSEVISPEGRSLGTITATGNLTQGRSGTMAHALKIAKPQFWSPDSPVLYTLKSRLSVGSTVIDETTTPFGIRTLRFDPDEGFFLNGEPMKLKGVCLHHDAGALGAAVPEEVWERRLRILKEIGVNAIRTSHNPPAPELLDLCDRLGFLVKDEALDEFTPAKNKWVSGWNAGQPSRFGYAELFERWSVIDVQDMVRRDRNHPSVIMWSIGNEIDYPNDPFSHPVLGDNYRPANPSAEDLVRHAKPLIAAVKQFDSSRPVTMALANTPMSDAVGLGELLDVVGYNYQEQRYAEDHAQFPDRFIFGSETSHRYSGWAAVRTNDYVSGQFLWTGIDYLGEARVWPNRANGSGLLDLCGFKKPNAWFRQSLWSDEPMVYLCASARSEGQRRRRRVATQEHWNWPADSTVAVRCYTTCPEVTLTLNGRTLGTQSLADADQGVLTWRVPFEPGVLKAIGIRDGVEHEFTLRTAGPAQRIELISDPVEAGESAREIQHVEFRVVDEHGTRVPDATHEITLSIDGPAELLCMENGDRNSPSNGKSPSRNAHQGRGLAILQSSTTGKAIQITAKSPGLATATIQLR